ncbi:MAG: NAD-dependent epimerase/dehydratase family protein [Clostridiales bacterium]|nr:NAD-dependent epimerase/dehydratase family protein [Clostridiales bacterium]
MVYGEALTDGKPTKEEHPFLPISLYAASKIASEALIEAWSALNNTKAWVFRLANVVGPRATHGVIFDFVKKLKENPKELEILGNGNQRKSYIYVDDCIDAMLIGRNKSNMNVNIFNIGSEDWITVKEIAEIVSKVMGLRPEFKFTGGDRGWPGDVPLMKLDISKIRSLGFRPRLSSKEAVERTATWLLNYL